MEEKQYRKWLRRDYRKISWALVFYALLMEVLVSLSQTLIMLRYSLRHELLWEPFSMEAVEQAAMGDITGYFVTAAVGLILLIGWKGMDFWHDRIWEPGRPMTAKRFFALLSVFMTAQIVGSAFVETLDLFFSQFQMDVNAAYESFEAYSDTLGMFVYSGILAPVTEEILFRGLLQKSLEPHGRKFAVVTSAFLFGIFHGNLSQAPAAILVGLVLGYIATEYSIAWCMLLHMVNNMVFSDLLPRLADPFSDPIYYAVVDGPVYALALVGAWVLFRYRGQILQWQRRYPLDKNRMLAFYGNSGMIVLLLLSCASMVYSLVAY